MKTVNAIDLLSPALIQYRGYERGLQRAPIFSQATVLKLEFGINWSFVSRSVQPVESARLGNGSSGCMSQTQYLYSCPSSSASVRQGHIVEKIDFFCN